jgi:hypothetical protein
MDPNHGPPKRAQRAGSEPRLLRIRTTARRIRATKPAPRTGFEPRPRGSEPRIRATDPSHSAGSGPRIRTTPAGFEPRIRATLADVCPRKSGLSPISAHRASAIPIDQILKAEFREIDQSRHIAGDYRAEARLDIGPSHRRLAGSRTEFAQSGDPGARARREDVGPHTDPLAAIPIDQGPVEPEGAPTRLLATDADELVGTGG